MVRMVILGSGQDGGVPQLGCDCSNCLRARSDPQHRRLPPSVAVVGRGDSIYLIDPSPCLPEQMDILTGVLGAPDGTLMPRAILITHCHWGHYAGLGYLGREVANTPGLPVYCSRSVDRFLCQNRPWSDLVYNGNLELHVMEDETAFELEPGLEIRPRWVPHRTDVTDTVAYQVEIDESGTRTLLYMPDVDALDELTTSIIAESDAAIIDGTFFSLEEVGFRGVSALDIPHPPLGDALEILKDRASHTDIVFSHFNHTNPVNDPGSEERQAVIEAGFRLAHDGMVID